ncbi:MAG TPA: FecR domain-containing protein [Methylomirabilota bacterium]
MRGSLSTFGSLSLALSVLVSAPAWAQGQVGVVTSVVGPVTVTRASLPEAPLKFKDGIFLRDRVTTGDNAMTRILMGGKVVVTARERSTLTITEVPGLSTIDLTSGRIAVAVDKTRMKPSERVDVRTPNAIAGVRGTVLIVETQGKTSSVTVLTGLVDVVRVDPVTGRPVGRITPVGARQVVTVRNNVLPARAHAITPQRSQQLSEEFTPPMRRVTATATMPVETEVARATALLDDLAVDDGPGTRPDGGLDADRLRAVSSGRATQTTVVGARTATGVSTTSLSPTTSLLSTSATTTTTTTTTNALSSATRTTTNLLSTTTNTLTSTTGSLLQPATNLLK